MTLVTCVVSYMSDSLCYDKDVVNSLLHLIRLHVSTTDLRIPMH